MDAHPDFHFLQSLELELGDISQFSFKVSLPPENNVPENNLPEENVPPQARQPKRRMPYLENLRTPSTATKPNLSGIHYSQREDFLIDHDQTLHIDRMCPMKVNF